ncbi:MAG TPA: hypothetical protein VHV54_16360 [Candidatus Binatia bacterium]|nr:hypothetical protein [Candidatus Binatia bacterium]
MTVALLRLVSPRPLEQVAVSAAASAINFAANEPHSTTGLCPLITGIEELAFFG